MIKRAHLSPKITHQTKSSKTTEQEQYSTAIVAVALTKNTTKNIKIPPIMSPRIPLKDTRR
jgi:hypothetical protein